MRRGVGLGHLVAKGSRRTGKHRSLVADSIVHFDTAAVCTDFNGIKCNSVGFKSMTLFGGNGKAYIEALGFIRNFFAGSKEVKGGV